MIFEDREVKDQILFEPEPKIIHVRYFSECVDCRGNGTLMVFNVARQLFEHTLCPACRGTGEVEVE